MKIRLDTRETEQDIAWNTAVRMRGAMLAGPQHTFEIPVLFLSGEERQQFVEQCNRLACDEITFPLHWRKRLLALKQRVEESTAVLIAGFKQIGKPSGVDCGICGFPTCEDFFRFERPLGKPLCPVELMSFSSAVSRGLQMAHQCQVAHLLTQSLGKTALMLQLIDADCAVGILLEVGQEVKTAGENKMPISVSRDE
jgi:uncharacterized ferredoxin-like protein